MATYPTLVLLPGTDGTGALFHRFRDRCELETQVVSYPPDEILGYADLEDFVRKALPRNRSFILVAESFSGPIATSIASKAPEGLVGLVLCASFIVSPVSYLRPFSAVLGVLPTAIPPFLLSTFLMGRFRSDDLLAETQRSINEVRPDVLRHRLQEVLRVDYRTRMRKVKAPALYLRATEDRVVSQAASRHFRQHCSHGKVVDIKAPHFLLQCCPRPAAARIQQFAEHFAANH
ncbi:MAG: alpha/beta fold hydrolase [Pseudomonadota bacterium]